MARGRNSLTIRANTAQIDTFFDALSASSESAARPAAQAGAQVLYDEVKRNVARIGTKTGNLASAIYQAFSADNSGKGRATYHISWNAKKAPHGHLVEYGHIQRYAVFQAKNGKWITDKSRPIEPRHVGAKPFVRPAEARFPEAMAAMETEYFRFINEGPGVKR